MIEVYDIQDIPNDKPYDITRELAVAAYNTLRQYTQGIQCPECVFSRNGACGGFHICPRSWPDPAAGRGNG